MDDTIQVRLYCFLQRIGEYDYVGQIPATSFEDARSKVSLFGGIVDGQLEEQQSDRLCSICRGDIIEDLSNPKPISREEWQENFDF